MPDIVEPGPQQRQGPQIQRCPRCGREVRAGIPWAHHREYHVRTDLAERAAADKAPKRQVVGRHSGLDVLRRAAPETY